MKLHQRPYQEHQLEPRGEWYPLHHGLYTRKDFGKVEHGPEYFLEHSALLCAIDASRESGTTDEPLTTMELGAGWGQKTLDMVSYCNNLGVRVLPYLVEADPTHYKQMLRVLKYNNIPAFPLYGAVSGTNGWASFANRGPEYKKHAWAQHLARKREKGDLEVPVYSLRWLFETFQLDRVHVLHMDVQGAETAVIMGGKHILSKVDTFIIGIHGGNHITDIPELFKKYAPEHKVILTLPKHSGEHKIDGFDHPIDVRSDGVLILSQV